MTEKKNCRASFKNLFIFSLNSIWRKVIIVSSLLAYIIVICLFTSIIPVISEKSPIRLFGSIYSILLLMLFVSAVISIIALEIFRTPIDEGTELLIITKPISRKEIIAAKLTILLIYVLILSVIGSIFTSFTYLVPNSNVNDSSILVLGVFVGTLINGLFFSSIATILSIYFKKIISISISVGISFALLMMTFLGSFTIKSPVNILVNSGYTVTPITILDNLNDKKTNSNKIHQVNALFSSGIPIEETIEGAWNKAAKSSSYKTFSVFDVGYQLSSLYTLYKTSNDVRRLIGELTNMSLPIDIIFDNSYKLSSNSLLTKVKVSASDFPISPFDNYNKPINEMPSFSIEFVPLIYDYASINYHNESKDIYKLKLSSDFVSTKSPEFYLNKWNQSWKNYGNKTAYGDTNNVSNYSYIGSNDTLNFLNMYFKDKQHNLDKNNLKNVLTDLCEIQLGGLIKISQQKDLTLTTLLSSDEFMTILALSEIEIKRKEKPSNFNILNLKENANPIELEDILDIKKISTMFQYNGNVYRLDLLSNFGEVSSFKNFVKISTKSSLNINYTIPAWTIITFLIFTLSSWFYIRKDFS